MQTAESADCKSTHCLIFPTFQEDSPLAPDSLPTLLTKSSFPENSAILPTHFFICSSPNAG